MKPIVWSLCLGLALACAGCGIENRLPAEMANLSRSQPAGGEKSLLADIHMDIGSLELSADRKGAVYSVDLDYDKAIYEPQVSYDSGETGKLSFRLENNRKVRIGDEKTVNRLRLGLSGSAPVNLQVNTGVGDTRLALTGIRLSELALEAGVGSTKITSYQPNEIKCDRVRIRSGIGSLETIGLGNLHFRDFEFDGGVGGATLEFSGDWQSGADIRIRVGIGGVNVRMPRSIGVQVSAEKKLLSGFHLDGFAKRDSDYYSESYDKAKVRVSMRITTGIGGFRITWI